MKLTLHEEIAAPRASVWEEVTDIARFEAMLAERGIEVRRTGGPEGATAAAGMAWRARAHWQGAERSFEARLAEVHPPEAFRILVHSGGLKGEGRLTLEELAEGRTRAMVALRLTASGVAARVLLGGLSVASAQLEKRLALALDRYARRIETTRGG